MDTQYLIYLVVYIIGIIVLVTFARKWLSRKEVQHDKIWYRERYPNLSDREIAYLMLEQSMTQRTKSHNKHVVKDDNIHLIDHKANCPDNDNTKESK